MYKYTTPCSYAVITMPLSNSYRWMDLLSDINLHNNR